jgi:hypothetical protein
MSDPQIPDLPLWHRKSWLRFEIDYLMENGYEFVEDTFQTLMTLGGQL